MRKFLYLLCLFLVACSDKPGQGGAALLEPAGSASTRLAPRPSSVLPVANLPAAEKATFYAGKALAGQPWIKAPTATDARDGLGPLYNARSCLACHRNGGKGKAPDQNEPLFGGFVRLSLTGLDERGERLGVLPHPVYGDQIQTSSISLSDQLGLAAGQVMAADPVAAEAKVYLNWQEQVFSYPDGGKVSLRKPEIRVKQLAYGALGPDVLLGLRLAPAIHGVGLLELIEQADIDAWADPGDRDDDGISGRVNRVWDFEKSQTAPGRFGWKANRPNLLNTTAAAFAGDIGISNPLFPGQPCTAAQSACQRAPTGNNADGHELPRDLLNLVTDFVANIGVPARREISPRVLEQGRQHFHQAGCANCHRPEFTTAMSEQNPHLGGLVIRPYSDLLLHDMGPGLADGRPDYNASGSEWRTAPLWGTGISERVNGSKVFLHDGRARSIEEAILWHGGEAQAARDNFARLSSTDRQYVLQFVESL